MYDVIFDRIWCGVVWCGVVWCVVRCGVVCGEVWCGVVFDSWEALTCEIATRTDLRLQTN